MTFASLKLLDNLTAITIVPKTPTSESYIFYQIGMVYLVDHVRDLKRDQEGDLRYEWINLASLSEDSALHYCGNWLNRMINTV